MSPHSWANPEQDTFMQGFYSEFVQCQAKREYSTFWPPFYEQWFAKFPERVALFPDIPRDTELSEEQKVRLAEAVNTRKEQLRNKLRNKWGASKKARQAKEVDIKAATSLISEIMQSANARTQKPQKIEAYLSLHYEDKVRPSLNEAGDIQKKDVMAAAASDEQKTTKLPPKLSMIMKKAREMFKNEPPEVKAKVEERWEEMVAERELEKRERKKGSMKDTQYYIDKLAPTVGQFLSGLQGLTDWSFTVLMGGPSPETGGKVEACSIHVGNTDLGYTFDQAYPEFNNGIMRPYRDFLERVVTASPSTKVKTDTWASPATEDATSVHVDGTLDQLPSDMERSVVALQAPLQLTNSGEMSSVHVDGTLDQLPNVEQSVVAPQASLQLTNPGETLSVHMDGALGPLGLVKLAGAAEQSVMAPPAQPLQLTNPGEKWSSDLASVPVLGNDNFSYDFGSQTAIESLDNFLAKYSDQPLSLPYLASTSRNLPLWTSLLAADGTSTAHLQATLAVPQTQPVQLTTLQTDSLADSMVSSAIHPPAHQTTSLLLSQTVVQNQLSIPVPVDSPQITPSTSCQQTQPNDVSAINQPQTIAPPKAHTLQIPLVTNVVQAQPSDPGSAQSAQTVPSAMQSQPEVPCPASTNTLAEPTDGQSQPEAPCPTSTSTPTEPIGVQSLPKVPGPTSTNTPILAEPSAKHVRKPSQRVQQANSISNEPSAPTKKRSAASSSIKAPVNKKKKAK